MNDQLEPNNNVFASEKRSHTRNRPHRDSSMNERDPMLIKLLDELVRAWLETHTTVQIGNDPEKIGLLQEAREAIREGEPSELVKQVYREVFLREFWNGSGRTASEAT